MMTGQGLAPLSVIYRTFGAFRRTLIFCNSEKPNLVGDKEHSANVMQ